MKLKGALNFRDLGGHLTQDGRRVKKNRVFRSGNLSKLSADDCAVLETLSIAHVLDYRDHHESEREKNAAIRNVVYEVSPAAPRSHSAAAAGADFFSDANLSALAHDFMETFYENLPFGNSAYKRLFAQLEDLKEGALLHHCAVGKDRTGVASALILLALGVPKDAVLEEYLRTNEGLKENHEKLLERVKPSLSPKALERFHYVTTASARFLQAALDAILKKYETIEAYLQAEYGLSPERLRALRDKYLEAID